MNTLRVISILLIVFSLSTVSIASVFGQLPTADKYENLGIRHDSRPNVCLFEPNPTHVDWDYWKAVEIESWKAVLDW